MTENQFAIESHNFVFRIVLHLLKLYKWKTIEEMLVWFSEENERLMKAEYPDVSDVESGDVK